MNLYNWLIKNLDSKHYNFIYLLIIDVFPTKHGPTTVILKELGFLLSILVIYINLRGSQFESWEGYIILSILSYFL